MSRPGDRLRASAARVFDADTMERVIDPAIADLQAEPLTVGRYLAVVKVLLVCAPEVSMSLPMAAVLSALATVVVVAVLELPALLFAWVERVFDARMIAYLIPQGLSVAACVGLTLGILAACGGRAISRRAVAAVLGLAIAVGVLSFVNNGWLTPAANQAFRVALRRPVSSAGAPFARGFNELTFGEIRQQFAMATRDPAAIDPTDLHYLAVSYQGRWALTVAPVAFTIFALVINRRRPLTRWMAGIGVCVAYLSYLLYLSVPRLVAMDGPWLGGAAWYPLVVLAAVIAAVLTASRLMRRPPAGASA